MLELLKRIFIGCEHKWEFVQQVNLNYTDGTQGVKVILCCTKCGDYKSKLLV
jgi:hypothetical protein